MRTQTSKPVRAKSVGLEVLSWEGERRPLPFSSVPAQNLFGLSSVLAGFQPSEHQ